MNLYDNDRRKCEFCNNFMTEIGTCKFCHFEYDETYNPYAKDGWDLLNLDEDDGWEHIQILDRLHYHNIDCLAADIWYDNSLAYLIGCQSNEDELARVLGIHKEVIYQDHLRGWFILNLFQEQYLRGDLN